MPSISPVAGRTTCLRQSMLLMVTLQSNHRTIQLPCNIWISLVEPVYGEVRGLRLYRVQVNPRTTRFSAFQANVKHHPLLWEGRKQKKEAVPFLVYKDGEPLHQLNSITRIINSVLGKGVGSSALRHIYLTHKYGDVEKEQQKDAAAMAHSVGQQKEYILK